MNTDRIALCLSGGGYRAALFHLGALRRLNELGILPHIGTIASVSGGSILSAHLATQLRPWPQSVAPDWEERIERPFRRFVQRNIRTWPVVKRAFPWNWCRSSTQVKALQASYRRHLTDLSLVDLPERPNFVFCGTDMTHGVNWVFERTRVGSYANKYMVPDSTWPLAQAVAASSCFPPVFAPLPVGDSLVSDGGLYDNLALEPVKVFSTVLVSDGGAPFQAGTPKDLISRWKAYLNITGKQTGSLRKRMLIGEFQRNERSGCYWGIGSAASSYGVSTGYSKALASQVIARIRTDLDAFSDVEIDVLMNHGYMLADVALTVHAPGLVETSVERNMPNELLMDESRAREMVAGSGERRLLGRF